jgi:hypothetical protein
MDVEPTPQRVPGVDHELELGLGLGESPAI